MMKLNRPYWRLKQQLHDRAGAVWREIESLEDQSGTDFGPDGDLVALDPFNAERIAQLRAEYAWLAKTLDGEDRIKGSWVPKWWTRFKNRKERW